MEESTQEGGNREPDVTRHMTRDWMPKEQQEGTTTITMPSTMLTLRTKPSTTSTSCITINIWTDPCGNSNNNNNK